MVWIARISRRNHDIPVTFVTVRGGMLAWLCFVGVTVALCAGCDRTASDPRTYSSVTPDNHFAIAEADSVTIGGAIVRVKHWSIRRVPGTVHGEHRESPEEYLVVNMLVSTESPSQTFEFHSWHKPRDDDGFRAVDNLGNRYARVKFPSDFEVKWQVDRELVSQHEPLIDRIVIEKPHRSAREIRIILPSRNVTGVDGPDIQFRFVLKRAYKDEHGSHEFDPRDLPAKEEEVRREADKAQREKHEAEKEVHREAEKAEHERSPREEEARRLAERAHEEEMRRLADKEAEEQAARRAEREAQRKRDADAAAVRAQMEEKAKEKDRLREEEKRVSERLDRDEKYAAELLHLAKQFIDTDKPDKAMAAKKLTEIIEQYPNTQAAKEAKKLRAGL